MNFKGVVVIDKYKTINGEQVLIESQEHTNTCTENVLSLWFSKTGYNLFNANISITPDVMVRGHKGLINVYQTNLVFPTANLVGYPRYFNTDEYLEFAVNFAAPSVSRDFRSVLLTRQVPASGSTPATSVVYAYLDLVSSCRQEEGVQLIITYKVYFPVTYGSPGSPGPWNSQFLKKAVEGYTGNRFPVRTTDYPYISFFNKHINDKRFIACGSQSQSGSFSNNSSIELNYTTQIGDICRSVIEPGTINTTPISKLPLLQTITSHPSGSVIQDVFPKTDLSTRPFLDVTSYVTTAPINVSNDNSYNSTTPYDFPYMYKVQMETGGYLYKKRKYIKTYGNAYREAVQVLSYPIFDVNGALADPSTRMQYTSEYLTDQTKQMSIGPSNTSVFKLSETKVLFLQNSSMMVYDVQEDDAILINSFCSNVTGMGTTHSFVQATEIFTSSLGDQTFLVADKSTTVGGVYAVNINDIESITVSLITSKPILDNPIHGIYLKNGTIYVAYRVDSTTDGGFAKSNGTLDGMWVPDNAGSWTDNATVNPVLTNTNVKALLTTWANLHTIKVPDSGSHIIFGISSSGITRHNLYTHDVTLPATTVLAGVLASGIGTSTYATNEYGLSNYYDVTTDSVIYNTITGMSDNTVSNSILSKTNLITNITTSISQPSGYRTTPWIISIKQGSDYYVLNSFARGVPIPNISGRLSETNNHLYYVHINGSFVFTEFGTNDSVWPASHDTTYLFDTVYPTTVNQPETPNLHYISFPLYMGRGLVFSILTAHKPNHIIRPKPTNLVIAMLPANNDSVHSIFEDEVWESYGYTGSWVLNDPTVKPVHDTVEELDNGLFVDFPYAASSPTVYDPGTEGKNYVFYACDGILKTSTNYVGISAPLVALTPTHPLAQTTTIPTSNTPIKNRAVGSKISSRTITNQPATKKGWYNDGYAQAFSGSLLSDIPFFVDSGLSCTLDNTTNQITCPDHQFITGEIVNILLDVTGVLPTGLVLNTDYYIKYENSILQLTDTAGTVIDFSTNGSGVKLRGRYQVLTCSPVTDNIEIDFSKSAPNGNHSPFLLKIGTDYTYSTPIWTIENQSTGVENTRDINGISNTTLEFKFDQQSPTIIYATIKNENQSYTYTITPIQFLRITIRSGGVIDQELTLPYFGYPTLDVRNNEVDFMKIEHIWTYNDDYVRIEQPSSPPSFYDTNFKTAEGLPTATNQVYLASGSGLLVFHPTDEGKDVNVKLLWIEK